jgi:hypothetical protein
VLKTTPDMLKYITFQNDVCAPASRSSGPKDNFSTGQALNDLNDGLATVQRRSC